MMTPKFLLNAFVLLVTYSVFSQSYITHVTLVDVEKQQLIPNQTVVIGKDVITAIEPSNKIKIPAQATVIDGKGKYLIPGLTDAHVHFFQNGGLYARPDAIDLRNQMPYEKEIELSHQTMEDKLRRYIQNGITTVIDVGATYHFLKQRDTFTTANYAPSIYMTGPLLTTYEPSVFENLKNDEPFHLVKKVEDGIKGVQDQLPLHPDFIKIWYITSQNKDSVEISARKNQPIIKAIIEEAHRNKLKVAVHATEQITAQLAVESGCDFLVHSVDNEIVSDNFIRLLKQKKTILCPTLVVSGGYSNTFGQKNKFSQHELAKANPNQLGSLLDLKHMNDDKTISGYKSYFNSKESIAEVNQTDSICRVNLKKLVDAGIVIATGTDAGNIGTLHAASYLSEVKAMQKSGMSNWQILKASTINGAKILDKEKEFGTITVGKKANLVLLEANPIEAIENITAIHSVINKGIVWNPNTLLADTPTDLAQKQLNAYNMHNIEAFLEPYADDVEVYDYPNTLIYKGKETMRQDYAAMFEKTPDLYCELVSRIVQGNTVIDKERLYFSGDKMEGVAMYIVQNGKIKKVYFIK